MGWMDWLQRGVTGAPKLLKFPLIFHISGPFVDFRGGIFHLRASLVAQKVKNLPALQETWPLGQEDALEKGMATLSHILAWETPWTEEPGGLQSIELHQVRHNWATNNFTVTFSLRLILIFKKSTNNSSLQQPQNGLTPSWHGKLPGVQSKVGLMLAVSSL